MSILILSNSAPNYHFFFNSLAAELKSQGERVIYAVDSEFSRKNNKLDDFSDDIYVFSDFFSSEKRDPSVLELYRDYNLNYALLSDFERSEIYGILRKDQYNNDFFDELKISLIEFFENIFDKHSPTMVIYENVSNTFSYFAYLVAQRRQVPYKGFSSSRLPGRFELSRGPFDFEELKKTFDEVLSGEISVPDSVSCQVSNYIAEIEAIEPDYMKANKLSDTSVIRRYFNREKFIKLLTLFKYGFQYSSSNFQIGNPLKTHINLFLRNLFRNYKCRILENRYDEVVEGEDYFLYPLHFHPESSTSILAGNDLDEYEVIRSTAFNLPEGARLYVKDHKSAWGYPSLKFYKKIRRIPNVRLLSPHSPTKKLIKASKGVVTLTSTVGYEALLMNKPVLLFGRVFYEAHRSVRRVKSKDKIHDLLLECMDENFDDLSCYNQKFVESYWMVTHEGSLNMLKPSPLNKRQAQEFVSTILS